MWATMSVKSLTPGPAVRTARTAALVAWSSALAGSQKKRTTTLWLSSARATFAGSPWPAWTGGWAGWGAGFEVVVVDVEALLLGVVVVAVVLDDEAAGVDVELLSVPL
jgi:hypothetical protein